MKKKLNLTIMCFVLIVCCVLGAIPATAKLEIMSFTSSGEDIEVGVLTVGEKVDLGFSDLQDDFYKKWTDTDTYPEPIWTSSNSTVASVDSTGNVVAKKAGNAIVYATFQYAASVKQIKFYITVVKAKNSVGFERFSGNSRYETSVAISKAGWSAKDTNTVILVNSKTYADALVSVPLAYAINAPILLTDGVSLDKSVADNITELGVKNILIIGGSSAVSEKLENSLKSSGYSVDRCYGINRFETAIEIAKRLNSTTGKKPTSAFVVTSGGYADALSICAYASISNTPSLYVNNAVANNTPTYNYIKSNSIENVTIIGGVGVASDKVEKDLAAFVGSIDRISGDNRFLTSLEVAKTYSKAFSQNVMLATGMDFPDALAGGVLASKLKTPVLLVNKSGMVKEVESFIRLRNPEKVYVLGGVGVIPESVITGIF